MKDRRWLILALPLSLWILGQVFLWRPDLFFVCLSFGALLIILSAKLISAPDRGWPPFVIAPLLFFLSFSLYSAIIINRFWIQFIFLLVAWFAFSYFKDLYHYRRLASDEMTNRFGALFASGGFLTVFAAAAVLFDLPVFINWPLPLMLLIFMALVYLLFIQFLFLRRITWEGTGLLIITGTLILTELAWVLSFLPLDFNVLALLLAIFYYLVLAAVRLYWRNNLNSRALRLPIILSAGAVVILLLTARWL